MRTLKMNRNSKKTQNLENSPNQSYQSRIRREGGLKVYYTNCRSLRNKIDLLRGKACVENFDIIAITETWIDINSKNFLSEFIYFMRIEKEGGEEE